MAHILKKAAKYRHIGTVLFEGEAHLKDPFIPPPQILKPTAAKRDPSPEDITDFPETLTVPIPESIPYREGQYRPPSIPLVTGTRAPTQASSRTTPTCSRARCTPGARAGSRSPTRTATATATTT